MPVISDVRHFMLIYNPSTLTASIWDGSLNAGAVVIGAVTQSGTWNVGTVTTLTTITNPVTVSGAVVTL